MNEQSLKAKSFFWKEFIIYIGPHSIRKHGSTAWIRIRIFALASRI